MYSLQSDEDKIELDTSQSIGALSSQAVTSLTYTNLTVTYVPGTSYTSDVNFQTNNQSISAIERIISHKDPDLPCSVSGSTSISYSIGNYTTPSPSWVTISSSGSLAIEAPGVTSDTQHEFLINSIVSGNSNPIPKLIKLTIIKCLADNCQNCDSTNNTICAVCISNYYLFSGQCIPSSKTAQTLSKVSTSAAIAITGMAAATSLINASSISSLWMTMNQLQLFFLLLLTRAYIPADVQAVIEGSDFASNIYSYIPTYNWSIYDFLFKNFEFELTNQLLQPIGIEYSSTIANSSNILIWTVIIYLISHVVYHLRR